MKLLKKICIITVSIIAAAPLVMVIAISVGMLVDCVQIGISNLNDEYIRKVTVGSCYYEKYGGGYFKVIKYLGNDDYLVYSTDIGDSKIKRISSLRYIEDASQEACNKNWRL